MTTAGIFKKMIEYSNGNIHDINHFLKVYGYAKTIGDSEGLSAAEMISLETAAIIHDIACPLCREKYGNTDGKYQEKEGIPLALEFFKDSGLPEQIIKRVVFLVGHHHTLKNIKGADYQILIESDFLVNADESKYSEQTIRNALENIFKTETGISLLKSVYGIY